MIRRHLRLNLSQRGSALLAVGVICQLLALLTLAEETRAQQWHTRESSGQEMITEIWMSGDSVAVSRRVPRNNRARELDDDLARSMAELAEQQFIESDPRKAEWLVKWAEKLSHGRIDANGLAETQRESKTRDKLDFNEQSAASIELKDVWIESSSATVPPSPAGPLLMQATPPPSLSYPIESSDPIASATMPGSEIASRPTKDQLMSFEAAKLWHERPFQGANVTQTIHKETVDKSQPFADLSMESPSSNDDAAAGRALYASQAEPISEPTFLLLVSFTSGFVFCVGLVALIAVVPRRNLERDPAIATAGKSLDVPRETWDESGPTRHNKPDAQVSTPDMLPLNPTNTDLPKTADADETSSLVEDFFQSNVELLKRCA